MTLDDVMEALTWLDGELRRRGTPLAERRRVEDCIVAVKRLKEQT